MFDVEPVSSTIIDVSKLRGGEPDAVHSLGVVVKRLTGVTYQTKRRTRLHRSTQLLDTLDETDNTMGDFTF